MKKISIIALHLGYGGVEKSISTLANLLATTPDIEALSFINLAASTPSIRI